MLITFKPFLTENWCNEKKVSGKNALSHGTIRFDLERFFEGQKRKFRNFENFQILIILKPLEIETWCIKQKVRRKNDLSYGIISFDLERNFQGQKSKFCKFQNFQMLITLKPLEIETLYILAKS